MSLPPLPNKEGDFRLFSTDFDIVIVGSGPSGVQAAAEAATSGLRVGMVDVGNEDHHYATVTPDKPWSWLRENDAGQSRYFLGEHLEGITDPEEKTGSQLTPARKFITRDVDSRLPLVAENFDAMQSLALGGLGAGWGAGCVTYDDSELQKIGLSPPDIRPWYEKVAADVGVNASGDDDMAEFVADFRTRQPPLEPDSNAKALLATYQKKRGKLIRKQFRLGLPSTAILTRPLGSRSANSYHDMDFWSDAGESVYRPAYTLRELRKRDNFAYLTPLLAREFQESEDGTVQLSVTNTATGSHSTLRCHRLLLAAGAINSARLALKSQKRYFHRLPILGNPYTYVPTINLPMLGRSAEDKRHSMVQLSGIYGAESPPEARLAVQFFSYRSLLLFKLAQSIPLPPSLAMLFCRSIATSLTIVAISHADFAGRNRWLSLESRPFGDDFVRIHSDRSAAEKSIQFKRERKLLPLLMSLKLVPLALQRLPEGASIRYAGTLPMSDDARPMTCDAQGRLRNTNGVYVVDSSSWKFLPAKGLTFTMMANARRVASVVAAQLAARPS